ncbi:ABC transporter ATP-binding protein [Streptomyces sp. VRA16 Mangrove soil]|uniref:ABC transporter ATP-binding protein n=1 Tax=Streptomyces sp. VRA16 Mangrove soil TaxID=2817434 RepID=UPI001A9E152A|nr:oligopeptide/dipeptide ABC transporter ATP-binding protein [Streptomyces sp. VRA16 Mangrove soil]MBO1329776.1 ATP-binding cassette domain-containing protein [Streptomyces sp. VRA16 Mangrove soil]
MTDPANGDVILRAEGLVKHYGGGPTLPWRRDAAVVRAVDGVDLELRRGQALGIVGESGCGKSTLLRLLCALERPTAGRLLFEGEEVDRMRGAALKRWRRRVQVVFQDPYASLNPRLTVGEIVGEAFDVHPDVVPRAGRRARIAELLELVGLDAGHADRYPHQFSGGQRQRIGIARGLALGPDVLLCDEPVSALDLSVQAQVVNLLLKLRRELGLALAFVSHDLGVVRHVCDDVTVMYLGKVAEQAPAEALYTRPGHPYTQALLSAEPSLDRIRTPHAPRRTRIVLAGDPPSPAAPPPGCRFHTRCPRAQDLCRTTEPALTVRDGRAGACHFGEAVLAEAGG